MTDPRYPIGKFSPQPEYTASETAAHIERIATLPSRLRDLVGKLSADQLNTTYRDGGWTARQVIHHMADSHMNAYIRTKWTLTESQPTIKAYNEKEWAHTGETSSDPILSLALLDALHAKWVVLLRSLKPTDLSRGFVHPESGQTVPLNRMLALYAWHGDHHLGHLQIVQQMRA